MSPRPYRLGLRQAAADQTRARILEAARAVIVEGRSPTGFTVDAVARAAGVARMTVYYQFGSKRGIVEALFNDLAARGGMMRIATAFQAPTPLEALDAVIDIFCGFWASDRIVLRRVRAMAALDAELGEAVRTRDNWRRAHMRTVLTRLQTETGRPDDATLADLADVLCNLSSFETYDDLATESRSAAEVAALLQRSARAIIGAAGVPPRASRARAKRPSQAPASE